MITRIAMVAILSFSVSSVLMLEQTAAAQPSKKPAEVVRLAPNYVQVPPMRLAISDDEHTLHVLELEVWLGMQTPEDAAALNSSKKKILSSMKEDFTGYQWEGLRDPVGGTDLAKAIVRTSIQRALPDGPPVEDVYIRTLVIR